MCRKKKTLKSLCLKTQPHNLQQVNVGTLFIRQLLIFIHLAVFILSTQMKLQTVVCPPLLHLSQLVIML